MSIIKTHDVTLYGGYGVPLTLRPLHDGHLPLLYQWSADPQVLYWTEGGEAPQDLSYGPEVVHQIYGGVSQSSLCFLVEADGVPIGECWLQPMNLPEVKAMYGDSLDVRRIDMSIGEKEYWGRRLGTQFVGMLVDYAFCGEGVDVLHCFCEDYNIRSTKIWERHGFSRVLEEPIPNSWKGQAQYHYRLTRREYVERRRPRTPAETPFSLPLTQLQPSQLYISQGKLRLVGSWFDPASGASFDPVPIKRLGERIVMLDGHTHGVAAHLAGWTELPVYWYEEDDRDLEAIALCVRWCEEEGVHSPADLAGRIVPHWDYEWLWHKRCMEMTLDNPSEYETLH